MIPVNSMDWKDFKQRQLDARRAASAAKKAAVAAKRSAAASKKVGVAAAGVTKLGGRVSKRIAGMKK